MVKKYFYSNGRQEYGPFSLDQIKYGRSPDVISDTTWIWEEGSSSRSRASELNDFRSVVTKLSSSPYESVEYTKPQIDNPDLAKHTPPPIPLETPAQVNRKRNNSSEGNEAGVINYILTIYKKSFTVEGRAARSEFWGFQLFYWLFFLGLVAISLSGITEIAVILLGIFIVISIPAQFCLQVRRLHDLDWSGWWLLLGIIPYIGGFCLLIAFCFAGTHGDNSYDASGFEKKKRIAPEFGSEID